MVLDNVRIVGKFLHVPTGSTDPGSTPSSPPTGARCCRGAYHHHHHHTTSTTATGVAGEGGGGEGAPLHQGLDTLRPLEVPTCHGLPETNLTSSQA